MTEAIRVITKTIQGQEVEIKEHNNGGWSYRLVGVDGWRGLETKAIFHTQLQAENRAKKFIYQYFMSNSND